jgi:hypothetical protein
MPGNERAYELYIRVQDQVRTGGMDGVIMALDYVAVKFIMRMYGYGREEFEKMLVIFAEIQRMRARRRETT